MIVRIIQPNTQTYSYTELASIDGSWEDFSGSDDHMKTTGARTDSEIAESVLVKE